MSNAVPLSGNWSYPTSVRFGAGRIAEIGKVCKASGMTRPLLVTDPGLAGLPMIPAALSELEAAGVPGAVFSDVKGNPVSANVNAGLDAYRSGGHDGIIAWGGGSAMDCAKAIALMAGQTRPIWDFEDIGSNWKRADEAGIAPSSPSRPRQAQVPKWAAPGSSPMSARTRKRSSFTRN